MTDPEAFTAILAADECADWIASAHLKTTDDSPHHFSDADCPEMTGFGGGVWLNHGSASDGG